MSAPISKEFLSGSVSLILWLYDHYEERRQQTEVVCNDCRSLFLPWPKKIQKSFAFGEKSEGSGEVQTQGEMPPNQNNNEEDDISEKEKSDLALLDNLLAKAQKARDVQAKLSENKPARPHNKVAKPPKPQPSGKDPGRPLKTTNKDNVKTVCDSTRTGKNPGGQRHSYAQKVTKSADSKPKYVPAHSSAPFKTDQNLHKKKLVSRPRSADRSSASKTSERQVTKSKPEQRSADCFKDLNGEVPNTRLPPLENTHTNTHHGNECENMSVSNSKELTTKDSRQAGVIGDGVGFPSSHPKNVQQTIAPGAKSEEKAEFLLPKDGGKLSLPGKFKKLLHTNRKLREKLAAACHTSTVDKTDCEQKFLNRYEHALSSSKNKHVQLHRSVVELENDYKSVSNLLAEAKLDSLSEETCAKDVLKAKIILADVLSKFYSMEEEYQLIQKGLKVAKSKNLFSNDSPVSIENYRELDLDLHALHVHQKKQAPSQCELIQYKSLKKLTQFVLLKGHVDTLQVEQLVSDKTAVELLDYLKESNPEYSCFNEAYRSSYAMLCSSGRYFPAMVKDTLSNEDSDD
ncbi:uncharacterized protein LOC135496821 [Lineus longissimus]|uniref:uncharacterized protein LOC135496821 n=1 Tax=Lineus longissimus TaxID=88925 RepID=UPI002B4F60E9